MLTGIELKRQNENFNPCVVCQFIQTKNGNLFKLKVSLLCKGLIIRICETVWNIYKNILQIFVEVLRFCGEKGNSSPILDRPRFSLSFRADL